jgi:hypothetical protein
MNNTNDNIIEALKNILTYLGYSSEEIRELSRNATLQTYLEWLLNK